MTFSSDNVEVFLAVLDHGSFSAAARALGRVPSAVSMTIANLEAELDLNLFDRSTREPKATAAARSLEPQARLLAAQLKLLQVQALGLTQGLESRLTIAIAPELLAARWSAALATLGTGASIAPSRGAGGAASRCARLAAHRPRAVGTGVRAAQPRRPRRLSRRSRAKRW